MKRLQVELSDDGAMKVLIVADSRDGVLTLEATVNQGPLYMAALMALREGAVKMRALIGEDCRKKAPIDFEERPESIKHERGN